MLHVVYYFLIFLLVFFFFNFFLSTTNTSILVYGYHSIIITLRAITSVGVNFPSILHQKNYFFYFTHSFLQNTHINLSILHIYSIKYSFFLQFFIILSLIAFLSQTQSERTETHLPQNNSLSHKPKPAPHKPSDFSSDKALVHHAVHHFFHHVVHRLIASVGSEGWSSSAATVKVDRSLLQLSPK